MFQSRLADDPTSQITNQIWSFLLPAHRAFRATSVEMFQVPLDQVFETKIMLVSLDQSVQFYDVAFSTACIPRGGNCKEQIVDSSLIDSGRQIQVFICNLEINAHGIRGMLLAANFRETKAEFRSGRASCRESVDL